MRHFYIGPDTASVIFHEVELRGAFSICNYIQSHCTWFAWGVHGLFGVFMVCSRCSWFVRGMSVIEVLEGYGHGL